MLSFDFNGKNSFADYGIIISSRPNIPSPQRRVEYMAIPGRDSSVRYDEETYEDITIAVACKCKDNNLANKVDDIKGWLLGAGEGDLIFSFQDNKKYIAQVVNSIDFSQVMKRFSEFIIVFNCRPFKYCVDNSLITLTTSGQSVSNMGTLVSSPIISIYGNGNITLTIKGKTVKLYGISSKAIINSEIMDCYDASLNNLNPKMEGEFPKLDVGSNMISWSGSISKIEILPNWRWL